MVSRQHQDWINHGKPDSGLALPLQLLANTLSAAGYTVYVYPNDAHLDAEPPEDHTYYSETGWPNASPKWWRHAIDVMPKSGPGGGADLYALGQRIVADRQAGRATWIKYVNVPTSAGLGGAVQHRWEPGHASGASGDTGHIHISSVTGCETLDSGYNPLTSGGSMAGLSDLEVRQQFQRVEAILKGLDSRTDSGAGLVTEGNGAMAALRSIAADLAAVKAAVSKPAQIDPAALAAALAPVLAPLLPPAATVDVSALVVALTPALRAVLDGATIHAAS